MSANQAEPEEVNLDPEALQAAYEAHRAHAADPDRKGSGIEKAIRAYLFHRAAEPSREATIEECAKVAEAELGYMASPDWDAAAAIIAAAIRALTTGSNPT